MTRASSAAAAAPPRKRSQRVPQLDKKTRAFLSRLSRNTREFDAEGRVLRLKRFISADASCSVIDACLDALMHNTRVEVLYIQNFEKGFRDEQLVKLLDVLKMKRIWACNVGENFGCSMDAWRVFAAGLAQTNLQYMYASEHHFMRTNLKAVMRDAIRKHRERQARPHDPAVIKLTGNMWYNPKLPVEEDSSDEEREEEEEEEEEEERETKSKSGKRKRAGGRRESGAAAAARAEEEEEAPLVKLTLRRRGKRTQVITERVAALLRSPAGKDARQASKLVKGGAGNGRVGGLWAGVLHRVS